MLTRIQLTLLCLCVPVLVWGQLEASYWYFGDQAGLHFVSGSPVADTNSAMYALEGTASIADNSGNLLFYTNGEVVYNANHVVMLNGNGLLGDDSSSQSAIIVPDPGSLTKYYIFTVDKQGGIDGLRYSVVDMTLDGGLGGIVASQKNIQLESSVAERITGVRNTDSSGIWVIAHRMNGDEFVSYLVDASGVNTTPVVSNAGDPISDITAAVGCMKISPDGTKIASATEFVNPGLELLDFDRATGIVSNGLKITSVSHYGVEFSPDSKKLYASDLSNLYQYDISLGSLAAIQASAVSLAFGINNMQLALDGKIYLSQFASNETDSVGVIHSPNLPGTACNTESNFLFLEGGICKMGLPNFIQSYFQFNIASANNCVNSETAFHVETHANIVSVVWNFGDPDSGTANTANEVEPTHVYTTTGTFTVNATVTFNTNNVMELTQEITIIDSPEIPAIDNQLVCSNEITEVFDLSNLDATVYNGLNPDDYLLSYYATSDDAESGLNAISDVTNYEVSEGTQEVYIRLQDGQNGCYDIESVSIELSVVNFTNPTDLTSCDLVTLNDGYEVFDLTQQENAILNGLDENLFSIDYYELEANAEAGDSSLAISNPDQFTNTEPDGQQIFVRVTHNDTGCYQVVSFMIQVYGVPEVTTLNPLYECDYDGDGIETFSLNETTAAILSEYSGLLVTYYDSMTDLENGNPPLPISYTNSEIPNEVVYVLLENATTGCTAVTTLDLITVPPAILNIPDMLTYCDADNDGFGFFNLDAVITQVDEENTGDFTVSIHETYSDAVNAVNEFSGIYENIVAFNQTLYVLVVDQLTGCSEISELALEVFETPDIPSVLDDFAICDDNVADGFAEFDLSVMNSLVYGNQSLSDFDISFYATATAAEDGVNSLPLFYTNIIAYEQEVFVKLENVITGCYTIRAFNLVVNVNPVISSTYDNTLEFCDDFGEQGDELYLFDLTLENDEITDNIGGYAVSYYHTQAEAISGNNAITNDTAYLNQYNPETLFVRVTDVNTGCISLTTVTIRVLNNPSPLADPEALEVCDDDLDGDEQNGQAVFDLTTNEIALINGETNVIPQYFETYQDAFENVNAIINPESYYNIIPHEQPIFVRVTNTVTGCFTIVDFNVLVNALPEVTGADTFNVCETDNNYEETVWLEDINSFVLNGGDILNLEISYFNNEANAIANEQQLVGPAIHVTNSRVIAVRVYNTNTECVQTKTFTIVIEQAPVAIKPTVYALCESIDESGMAINDGVEVFNLISLSAEILGNQDPGTFLVSYYTSLDDAANGDNILSNEDAMTYTSMSTTLYAVVTNSNTGCTTSPVPVELEVEPLPVVLLDLINQGIVCIDATNNPIIGTDLGYDYTYVWNTGATTPTIEVTQGGEYYVTVTNINTLNQCSYESNHVWYDEASLPIVTPEIVQSEPFIGNNTISLTATGAGISAYIYQLDDISENYTGYFEGVSPGSHEITLTETNGCGSLTISVYVIDYMRYFTPNSDGVNDTWQVFGLENQTNATLFIFDRYGKLLKQMYATGNGWNGIYNGVLMPSDDYWFKLIYTDVNTNEVKEFTSHFTLKR